MNNEYDWVEISTRDAPEWAVLSWQARGIMLEIVRHVHGRTDRLSLGRDGLPAIARLIRAQWDEIEPYVTELIDDGWLLYNESQSIISVSDYCPLFQPSNCVGEWHA